MMNSYKVSNFFTTQKLLLYGLLILVVKILSVYYISRIELCTIPQTITGFWSTSSGDTRSYIESMENWIREGSFYYISDQGNQVFAGRMPYYGLFYLFFRLFFDPVTTFDALVMFQILLETVSILAIGLLVLQITGSRISFYSTLIISAISLNVTHWTNFIIPESLGLSFLIFFIFFYYQFHQTRKWVHFAACMFFLGWVTVLKPYYVFVYPLLGIMWLFETGESFKMRIRNTLVRSLVSGGILMLMLAPWIIRNYSIYHRFVPTQVDIYAGINYTKAELAWRKYVKAWGGSLVHWDTNSAGCFFIPSPNIKCRYQLPSKAVPPGYTKEDIVNIRDRFVSLLKQYNDTIDQSLEKEFLHMRKLIRQDDPFQYYLLSPFGRIKEFIFHSGSYYIPASRDSDCYVYPLQLFNKLLQSLLYYMTLITGFAGMIYYMRSHSLSRLMFMMVVMLIIIFPVILGGTEWRYFMYSYPFFVGGTSLLIHRIWIGPKTAG
jgi:hypothetical protein